MKNQMTKVLLFKLWWLLRSARKLMDKVNRFHCKSVKGKSNNSMRNLTGQFSCLLIRLTLTDDLLSAGSSSFGHSDLLILCIGNMKPKRILSLKGREKGFFWGAGVDH